MAPRTEQQRRGRAENERRRYTAKRLALLKERFPEMPPDVLQRAPLRHRCPSRCACMATDKAHLVRSAPRSLRLALFQM